MYGPRGEVLSTTDALGHTSTQNYDVFLRPLDGKTPKNQASGVYITTPAPVYDANDNVTQRTAPNGAVSTAVYDANDRATSSTVPPDTTSSPTRTNSYTYDLAGNQLTVTQPDGNVSGATAGSYTTTTAFDALGRPVAITDAVGDKTTSSYDDVGNKITMTDPVKNAIAGNATYTTQTAYDLDHRATVVTDAAGKTTSTAYDLDGAKISSTDQNNNTTLYSLDQSGRTTQVQVPHTSANGTITYNTTQYTYDQVGNLLATISPKGVASGVANAYTTKTTYNADNQRTASFGAYNPNDPVYNVAPETDYGYDAAGRLVSTTAPPSGGQSVRPATSLAYYDNGWSKSSTDPFGITTAYDYNALGQQTSRTITSAGGSSSRTMGWSYYPDGKLAGKTDSGIPVGLAVEMVDNSDVQNTAATGTWTPSSAGTGYQGYNYVTHAAGAGADAFTWNLAVPEDGTYQVYVQYPAVSGAATGASYQISYAGGSGGTATATADQTKNSGTWVSLGSYAFTAAGTGQKVTLAQNAGGSVTADAVKIVRNNSGDTQPSPNSFAYTYDPNGNLTDVADSSPGAVYNDYTYSYDGVNRLTQLQEKASGTVKHTTGYTYNADNMPLTMNHDASSAAYTYDVRNLLASVINKETSTDAGKSTSYTYAPTGQIATETKANGNVVTDTYNLDDSIAGTVEKTSAGTLVASHTLAYDPNGNETSDASSVQNADNHSAYITKTATDTYTPANQLASVSNSDGSDPQSYTYDQAGNITVQSVGGVSTTNVFDRDRLLTSTGSGVTAAYNYDPFGRTDSVTAGGTVIGRFTYDGFDHISSEVKNTGSGTVTTNYSYDALDRTLTQTDNAGGSGAKTTTFDYLATSSAIADEQVNGSVSKVYQYAATGERLDQIVHNSDGTEDPTYYSYNPHSDVQAITDSTGNTKATYGYSAYGGDDTSGDTGVDKGTGGGATGSTAASPYNVYRFNADRIDGTTGNYNMGFRNYDPSLNRFLSRDMYNGALSDMSMSADPYTGNRYAFGDGNPLSNIELDGHDWCWGCDVALGIMNFGAETIDSVANAIPDLYSLQSGMPASDLWQVDLKTPADNWATNQLEKNNPGWTPDWLDKQVTRGTTDFLNVASLFVGVGEIADLARGSAAAAKAADAAKEAEAAQAAARAAAKAAQSAEDRALQTAIKDGRVAPGAPVNHLNGAMAEELGWQTALSNGEVGIQGPGKITAVGPDYITYDPATGDINVWDAKYSSTGRFPSGLSASKLSSWMPDVSAAVNGYTGAYQAQIKAAFASGSVRGQIYGYDASKTGWSAP